MTRPDSLPVYTPTAPADLRPGDVVLVAGREETVREVKRPRGEDKDSAFRVVRYEVRPDSLGAATRPWTTDEPFMRRVVFNGNIGIDVDGSLVCHDSRGNGGGAKPLLTLTPRDTRFAVTALLKAHADDLTLAEVMRG